MTSHGSDDLEKRVADLHDERSRVERALEESRKYLQAVIDTIPGTALVIDRDFRVLQANRSAIEQCGGSDPVAEGLHCYEVHHRLDEPCREGCVAEKVFRTGRPAMSEHLHTDAQGRKRIVEVRTAPILDDNGDSILVIQTCTDLSRQRQAEAETASAVIQAGRRAAETAALLDASRTVLEVKDFQKAASSIYVSCKSLIGATAGYVALLSGDGQENEILILDADGRWYTEAPDPPMPIRGLRAVADRLNKAVYDNDFANSDWMRFMPDGHVALDNTLFAPLVVDGRTIGLLVLANKPGGFTEDDCRMASAFGEIAAVALRNNRTLEKLEASEERMRSVVETASDAIITIDKPGKIIFWNPAAEQMFGYSLDDVRGRPLAMIIPRRFVRAHQEALVRAVESGRSDLMGKTIEVTGLRKDGAEFPAELSFSDWKAGGEVFFTGIIRDITQRRQAEEEQRKLNTKVQQAQKLESLGILAGGIAHDFNNLLMVVVGCTDMLRDGISSSQPTQQYLEQIDMAANQAAELCTQMLAFSGKGRFVTEKIDLNDLINETSQLLNVSVSKKAELGFDLVDDVPPIRADASQIRQVLINLIINASEALCDECGTITVATRAVEMDHDDLSKTYLGEDLDEGRYVVLEVSDTGCGMEKETVAKVFDPFFTTKFTGRGLGLAAMQGIVQGHQGAVKIKSKPLEGSVFKIYLPAASESMTAAVRKSEMDETWQGSGTILLVDDEEMIRTVGKIMLTKLGFSVLTAADGNDALDIFRTNADQIACAIVDLTMPRKDGQETVAELRAIRKDVPIILSSGHNEQDVTSLFVGKELAGFIKKPYRLPTLKNMLYEALKDC